MRTVDHCTTDMPRVSADLVVPPRLLDVLPNYLAHLTGKGHRPRGRLKYRDNIRMYARWLGADASVADLTEEQIEAYRNARAQQIAAASVFNELVTLRSFCKWCMRPPHRYLTSDPTANIDYPKVPKPNPRALSRAQLKTLFQIIETEPRTYKATWQHNRVILLFMLYTGLRISEAAGTRWSDVDLDAGNITVRPDIAKNGRTRAIPIHPRLKEELLKLPHDDPTQTVITQLRSTHPLTPKSLAHLFERWLDKQGLRITAHRLRHSMATEMLRAGAKLPDIQAILGHEDLETTAIYLTTDSEHLRGAISLLPAGW